MPVWILSGFVLVSQIYCLINIIKYFIKALDVKFVSKVVGLPLRSFFFNDIFLVVKRAEVITDSLIT